jgi:hypothetical protein
MMLNNKPSFVKKMIKAKNEFVSMKIHFRYHTYIYTKKGTIYEGCKYCQDKLVNGNGKAANEKESEKSGENLMQTKNKVSKL